MTKKDFDSLLSQVNIWTPEKIKEEVQQLALYFWHVNNKRGTFEGATGVGKSKVGVLAAKEQFEKNPNSIVYVLVPTESLRDIEWPDEFRKWDCEHLINKVRFLCHASMQDEKVDGEIDLVILDECHNITPSSSTFFTLNTVWYILGLSATLPKNDPDKMAIINKFFPSCFKVTLDEATRLKLVSEFEIKVLFFDLDSVNLSVLGGTKKNPYMVTELDQYKSITKSLSRAMWKPGASEGMKFYWINKRVQFLKNLTTREKIAKDVMKAVVTPGTRTIIFCASIEQSKNLCGENIYNSKSSDKALSAFKNDEINHLGAVDALNEGKNLPTLDQLLIVAVSSKELDLLQRIGRTIRWREGHKAMVAILVARDTVDTKWYESATKNFDKKRIKEYLIKPEV